MSKIPYKKILICVGIAIAIVCGAILTINLLNGGNGPTSGNDDDEVTAITTTPENTSGATPTASSDGREPVVWHDAAIEKFIRQLLAKPEGDIYAEELEAVTELHIWGSTLRSGELDFFTPAFNPGIGDGNIGAPIIDEIKSIEDLRLLKNLQGLSLCGHVINDLSPLKALTGLKRLSLASDSIADASFLEFMPELTCLRLDYNSIDSLTCIDALKNLTYLDISYNPITDISALGSATRLEALILNQEEPYNSDNTAYVKDISSLSHLTGLRRLYLDNHEIEDITPLAELTGLEELDLSGNQVWDFSPLRNLKKLKSLWISGWGFNFNNLACLRELPELKTTDIDEQQWKKINYPFELSPDDAVEGIYPGNLTNGGFAGFDGKNVYYQFIGYGDLAHPNLVAFDKEALTENYISGEITDQMSKVTGQAAGGAINETVSSLNLYKGKLYFMSDGNNNDTADALSDGSYYPGDEVSGLTRVNGDGSDRVLLSTQPHSNINIVNDRIYCLDQNNRPAVLDLDGSNETVLLDEPCDWLYTDGQALLYQKDFTLYKANMDGSQPEKVMDANCRMVIPIGNLIYYMDESFNVCIYDRDRGQTETMISGPVDSYNVSADYIFYATEDGVYRTGLDGGNPLKIYSSTVLRINVIGDYLFMDAYEGQVKIKNDGSECTEYFEYFG